MNIIDQNIRVSNSTGLFVAMMVTCVAVIGKMFIAGSTDGLNSFGKNRFAYCKNSLDPAGVILRHPEDNKVTDQQFKNLDEEAKSNGVSVALFPYLPQETVENDQIICWRNDITLRLGFDCFMPNLTTTERYGNLTQKVRVIRDKKKNEIKLTKNDFVHVFYHTKWTGMITGVPEPSAIGFALHTLFNWGGSSVFLDIFCKTEEKNDCSHDTEKYCISRQSTQPLEQACRVSFDRFFKSKHELLFSHVDNELGKIIGKRGRNRTFYFTSERETMGYFTKSWQIGTYFDYAQNC